MAKSIRLKNDTYIDSSSIVYGKTKLDAKLAATDTGVINAQNTASSALNQVNPIGTVLSTNMITSNCTRSQNNYINSIVLSAGTWIVWGRWRYEGFDFSSWTNLHGVMNDAAVSCYDNEGYVDMTISNIVVCGKDHPVYLNLWPRGKDVTVKSNMWAVRIK